APVRGDSHSAGGLRFGLRNISGKSGVVPVVYHGENPPPLFKVGRNVVVSGNYEHGQLAGNNVVTKCPSKYTASNPSNPSEMADLGRAALVVTLGLVVYALVAGAAAAIPNRRRLAASARNALFCAFGSTAVASAVLAVALVRHDFSFQYV